jgi:hypothetical protein
MKMSEFMTGDSPYLCKEMLWDTPIIVTIDRVEGNHDVPIPESSRTQRKKVIFFGGKKLGLVLNTGHRKFLKRMFGGNDTRQWKGRKVMLYVDPTAKFKGKKVGGIRMAIGNECSGTEQNGPPRGANPPPLSAPAETADESTGAVAPADEPPMRETGDDDE